jgi:hypothetical protein
MRRLILDLLLSRQGREGAADGIGCWKLDSEEERGGKGQSVEEEMREEGMR